MHLTSSSSSSNSHTQPIPQAPCQPSSPPYSLPPAPEQASSDHLSLQQQQCGRMLPEECIEGIFDHLARDLSTLHSLLLVSKAFFRIAMPLLYACPFDLLESNHNWSPQERTRRHASLLYLLMNCCSKDPDIRQQADQTQIDPTTENGQSLWANLPPVCLKFQASHEPLKKPLVDYLSAYHHHYLCMNLSSTFPILFPNIQRYSPPSQSSSQLTPPPKGQVPRHHHRQQQQQQQLQQQPAQHSLANTTITMFTRNEIERTFLLHRPDLIKTISLPIQRLAAFQSIGPLLSSLVRFELYGISWHFNLDPAIEFLQQHSQLFGTIRELKMAGPNDVKVMQKPKIHRIMKAIKNPKLIDLSRYKEATRDLNSYEIQNVSSLEQLLFDLEFVPLPQSSVHTQSNAISIPLDPTQSSVATAAPPPPEIQAGVSLVQGDDTLGLIQQCANLTTLQIGVQSPTGFAWAVDRYNNDPTSLQQFKVLRLSSNRTVAVKQVLEDCVYAFRDSLEDLKGISLKLSPVVPSLSKMETTFGWSWPLNRLSVLSLKGELAVWFDLESLRFCPRLAELHLNLLPYSPPTVEHLEKVAIASQLSVLSLMGRWILTDRALDKLGKSLQKLKRLTLEGCECNVAMRPGLTTRGLTNGLDKMKGLRRLEIDLVGRIEAAMREYRESRPGLDVCIRSDIRMDDGLIVP